MQSKRIWELDAFRGLCVIGMVLVHFVYDLTELYRIIDWPYPVWFSFVKNWGGLLFLLLSGICVTLGSRSVRRGLIVFGCGLLVSAVTVGMYLLDFAGKGIIIYFGVLQCLGTCMILWPLFKKLPWWALAAVGTVVIVLGSFFTGMESELKFLMPLGIIWPGFASSDYFPLLPNFGFFLLGAALGRTVYKKKESLLPGVSADRGILGFLCKCGKHSLWIYLLHQPVLSGICMLLML